MNREQKRRLAKKINRMDEASKKAALFRVLLTQNNIQQYSSITEINPLIENYLDIFLHPNSLKKMAAITQSINDQMSASEAISLALLLCKKYDYILNKYVKYKNEYEKFLIANKYSEAKKILEKIKNECGYSLWTCGQLLIIEEYLNGLEGNKKLLESFLNETHRNTLISTILEFMSYRAENSTSLKNYNEKVDKFLRYFEDDISNSYFTYKLKIQDITINELCKYVLQIDAQLSIVDLYNSLIDITQRSTLGGYVVSEPQIDAVIQLYDSIDDFQLRNLSIYWGKTKSISIDEDILEIIESYTRGDYQYTLLKLQSYLINNPVDYQMWILYIKCNIYLGTVPENNLQVIIDLFSVYSLDDECVSSMTRLLGFLKKYADTSWRYKLLNTTKRKLTCYENVDEYITLSLLGEYFISPRFVSMLPDVTKRNHLMMLYKDSAPNSYFLLTENRRLNQTDCTSFRSELFYVDSLFKQKKYSEAIELLQKIYDQKLTVSKYVREKIIRRLFLAYCYSERIEEAISIIVNSFFDDENLIRRCNLSFIISKIKEKRSKNIFRLIEYPIFVYITDKFDFKEQRIAFSNYLDTNNIGSKEEFFDFIAKGGEKNIFFMEKICTPNVIKRHVRIFRNSTVATSIRNEILQQLIILNPQKKKEYLEEISNITTKKEINNRVRLVSQHKIKVDIDKIKEEKNELFEENFQKYLLIKSFNSDLLGFDINDSANIDSIKKIIESMNEEIKRNTQYSQTILALKDFITDILYEFLRNEKYGLDTYLSSRIRHGYCKAQLTKDLREHHLLLSTADDDSERFDISQFWDERVNNKNSAEYQLVKSALSEFTLDIENKIKEIRRDWIRIKMTKNEVGMFDFTSFVGTVLVVDKDNIVDYDMMFNYIIESLWQVTENNLQVIRKRIQSELKFFFTDKLNLLEKKIKECERTSIQDICQEILTSITFCRAKMQTVLNEFENFFYKDDVAYEDFSIESMASTCIGIEKQIHADFDKIKLNVNACEEKRIKGRFFSDFVEIIVMLMNNAITHAGFLDMESIELSLDCTIGKKTDEFENCIDALKKINPSFDKEDLLIISVKNNLSSDKDIQKISERVQYIFDNAKDPKVLKRYSITEGGSGIYKIYKTINYNVSVPYVILYSIEENEFVLFLAIDASTILV